MANKRIEKGHYRVTKSYINFGTRVGEEKPRPKVYLRRKSGTPQLMGRMQHNGQVWLNDGEWLLLEEINVRKGSEHKFERDLESQPDTVWIMDPATLPARLTNRSSGSSAQAAKEPPKRMPSPEEVRASDALRHFGCLVLEGVPGTGKTFAFTGICQAIPPRKDKPARPVRKVTFHPATAYEDFIEGLRPGPDPFAKTREESKGNIEVAEKGRWFFYAATSDNEHSWTVHDGAFLQACTLAAAVPEQDFCILIDEINRANVPSVLGDLLTLLEPSKRAQHKDGEWKTNGNELTLPVSKRKLFVPSNLYVVATMNTTDRSVTPLDLALRRRFAFVRVEPMKEKKLSDALRKKYKTLPSQADKHLRAWAQLNAALEKALGANAKLGHSYFFDACRAWASAGAEPDELAGYLHRAWRYAILPQLIETLRAYGRTSLLPTGDDKSDDRLVDEEEKGTLKTVREKIKQAADEAECVIRFKDGLLDSAVIEELSASTKESTTEDGNA